jgi:hypothetical protein
MATAATTTVHSFLADGAGSVGHSAPHPSTRLEQLTAARHRGLPASKRFDLVLVSLILLGPIPMYHILQTAYAPRGLGWKGGSAGHGCMTGRELGMLGFGHAVQALECNATRPPYTPYRAPFCLRRPACVMMPPAMRFRPGRTGQPGGSGSETCFLRPTCRGRALRRRCHHAIITSPA